MDWRYPVLLGGAAINPSFVGKAAEVGRHGPSALYPHGVFYCKDAFDGLATMDSLTNRERRDSSSGNGRPNVREKKAQREALVSDAPRRAPTGPATRPVPEGTTSRSHPSGVRGFWRNFP